MFERTIAKIMQSFLHLSNWILVAIVSAKKLYIYNGKVFMKHVIR